MIGRSTNPIIVTEMRGRMRGRRAFIALTLFLMLISCVAGGIYSSVYASSTTYYQVGAPTVQYGPVIGKAIFTGITMLLLALISFIAPGFTAGAIAGERERLTYDTLIITPLRASQIVWGKLGAVFSFLLLMILASIPIQSMALLFGGVEPVEVLIAALGLVVTMLIFGALGIFVSSLTRSTLTAIVTTYGIGIPFVYGMPFMIYYVGAIFMYPLSLMLQTELWAALAMVVIIYIFGFLLSINPISAALMTGILASEGKGYFFFTEQFGSVTVPFVSPWLVYVVFHSLLAALLIRWTIQRVAKISER
ncbi:MAG TPA: ABC transporter permease subunit [Anaerolineae bacterium]|nr:ABC transporter permease subunit [Anaerolineae bacterium]